MMPRAATPSSTAVPRPSTCWTRTGTSARTEPARSGAPQVAPPAWSPDRAGGAARAATPRAATPRTATLSAATLSAATPRAGTPRAGTPRWAARIAHVDGCGTWGGAGGVVGVRVDGCGTWGGTRGGAQVVSGQYRWQSLHVGDLLAGVRAGRWPGYQRCVPQSLAAHRLTDPWGARRSWSRSRRGSGTATVRWRSRVRSR